MKKKGSMGHHRFSTAYGRECMGQIKVNLEFLSVDNDYKCIVVSSPVAGEGKSSIADNLAVSLANSERKTILLDADLRCPIQHKLFNLVNGEGLSDIILNGLDWRKYAKDTGIPNLSVITAGRIPPNPADLLGSNRMGGMIKELKNEFDIVLFDSSPILLVPDPVSLSKHVDGFIIVARYNYTTIQNLVNTKKALQITGKPVIGSILNCVAPGSHRYDYGYHKYNGKTHAHGRVLERLSAAGRPAGK